MQMRTALISLAIVSLMLTSSWAQAESGDKPESDKAKGAKPRPALAVTPEREAAAMAFVKQHHSELADLLTQLKSGNAREYDKAVRELFRTSERLAQVRERDSQQYELDLKLWQVQSRVQLLTARLKMSRSKELREELRATLNEQLDARMAVLRRERERAQERLGDIDKQLKRLEEGRKQAIDRQVESLTSSPKPRPGKPGASKKNTKPAEDTK